MKKITIILLTLAIGACKPNAKKEETKEAVPQNTVESQSRYPEALNKVFDAHGGLKRWKEQRTLTYVLPNPENPETHTVDLWSRKDRIDTEKFSMGYDGNEIWLLDLDESYKGDAGFYHNLIFYFYGMPFLLADEGIVYGETEDLIFEDKSYPGIHVSYDAGIGVSSKDEYYIHYDPDTHQMAWLGYTVTYRSGEKSDNVRWRRYDDWQEVNGLLLPKSITRYNYENGKIADTNGGNQFENVSLNTEAKRDGFYAKPENAKKVEVKKS